MAVDVEPRGVDLGGDRVRGRDVARVGGVGRGGRGPDDGDAAGAVILVEGEAFDALAVVVENPPEPSGGLLRLLANPAPWER